jgi:hypothetical protein
MNYISHNTKRRTPESKYLCGVSAVALDLRAVFVAWS